ncbi:MAG TPA: Uma2 family endonuclease [Longimicrobium sp.]|nr:Uma2 family endonuclease [Longimicrobium sp.]
MHTFLKPDRRRFTSDEYERLGELGLLPESGVELLNGEVLEKTGWPTPRRWTYEDMVRMVEAGVLDEDERVELVDGEIICMTPIGHRHLYTVDRLTRYLGRVADPRAVLRVQGSLRFHSGEGPHPDAVLLRPHEDDYRSRQAGPWDAMLVVEVADTSLARDLEKATLYARSAIPEYWIADLNEPRVIVHQKPVGGEYTEVRDYRHGESFRSSALEGHPVTVEDVLGPL